MYREETPQAKLRNQLTPIYSLADMVLRIHDLPTTMIVDTAKQAFENKERINQLLTEIDNLNSVDISKVFSDHKFNLDVCLSYRHDFGLLQKIERDQIAFECKQWMIAIINNLPNYQK